MRKDEFDLTPKNILKALVITFTVAFLLGMMAGMIIISEYYIK